MQALSAPVLTRTSVACQRHFQGLFFAVVVVFPRKRMRRKTKQNSKPRPESISNSTAGRILILSRRMKSRCVRGGKDSGIAEKRRVSVISGGSPQG